MTEYGQLHFKVCTYRLNDVIHIRSFVHRLLHRATSAVLCSLLTKCKNVRILRVWKECVVACSRCFCPKFTRNNRGSPGKIVDFIMNDLVVI